MSGLHNFVACGIDQAAFLLGIATPQHKHDGIFFRIELTNNGIDPNDAGYALMAPLAEKAIADALAAK